ncbi:hypothetical protein FRC03_001498 [Tulasnella sp. 419]|nr:hypothetical protein FRC03_001498 [Tulasnella sp. 419]
MLDLILEHSDGFEIFKKKCIKDGAQMKSDSSSYSETTQRSSLNSKHSRTLNTLEETFFDDFDMSLSRFFMNEFRPLFRMMEEPFGHLPSAFGPGYSVARRHAADRGDIFNSFFGSGFNRPAVDLSEDGNQYIIEAEVPGVKKENLSVSVGDNGRSITIEGNTFTKSSEPIGHIQEVNESSSTEPVTQSSSSEGQQEGRSQALTKTNSGEESNTLSTERTFVGRSSFTRTVWLPRPVDGSKVSAKLEDGVLTLKVPKVEDKEAVRVSIE